MKEQCPLCLFNPEAHHQDCPVRCALEFAEGKEAAKRGIGLATQLHQHKCWIFGWKVADMLRCEAEAKPKDP